LIYFHQQSPKVTDDNATGFRLKATGSPAVAGRVIPLRDGAELILSGNTLDIELQKNVHKA
jgi:hypothetical protein